MDLENVLWICPMAGISVGSFFSANDSSTPPNSPACTRSLIDPCEHRRAYRVHACAHHARVRRRPASDGAHVRNRRTCMSQSSIGSARVQLACTLLHAHQTKVLLRKELFFAISVSNSFTAEAKVSDGLYTPSEPVSNCRDAPTRTRLSSCIYVANLMQLRRCERRYVACDPPTQPFQGKTFPNQQPRRGLV